MGSATKTERKPRHRHGFTLIETALATVIVGVGFTAMLTLLARGTIANKTAAEVTTAVHLAGNVRELTFRRQFTEPTNSHWGPENGESAVSGDSIEDLDGAVISPPIDADGYPIAACSEWSQSIQVRSVDSRLVTFAQPTSSAVTYPIARVTVRVLRNGDEVLSQSWLMADAK